MFKLFQKTPLHIKKRVLIINFIILACLHFIFVALDLYMPAGTPAAYTGVFDLDSERNLPTLYSSMLLAAISYTAWGLRLKTSRILRKTFWIAIALFFAYWALDEILILHERLAQPIRDLLHIGYDSVFYHAWVLIAMGLIGLVGILILVSLHLKSNPLTSKQRNFLIILFIYMSGIVLLEILGTKLYGNPQMYRFGIVPLEELFEIGMASYVLVKLSGYHR